MTFKLMNIVNVCLLGQGIGHWITSPVLIFPNLAKFDNVIRIIGGIMNTLWICDLPIVALLSVFRILIFLNMAHMYLKTIKLILALILFRILLLLIYGLTIQNMEMYPPGWGYDFTVPYSHTFDTLEISLSFPCLIISFISYLIITYLIISVKKLHSNARSRKDEIAILLQSSFVTTYITVMICLWHPALFKFVNIIDMTSITNQAILNGLWILHCYINPCMLLLFNKSFRHDCLRLLRERRIERSQTQTVIMTTVIMR